MTIAVLLGLGLIGAVTWVHHSILRGAAVLLARTSWPPSGVLLGSIYAAMAAHFAGAGLYAVGFWLGDRAFGIGSFEKVPSMDAMDYFYFSLVNMSTLGLGQIYPTEHLRFLAGVEALNGFLLISCSASFVFLAMKNGQQETFEALASRSD